MNPSNHQDDENILLSEHISYKEFLLAVNNLNVRNACRVYNVLQLEHQSLYYLLYIYFENSMVTNVWFRAITCPIPT